MRTNDQELVLNENSMERTDFNRLLLKTAFSCMACDGHIDKREVVLIKNMHKENKIFGDINLDHELENLLLEINRDGNKFLRGYFKELTSIVLSESDEFKIIEAAIHTIKADNKLDYSEIKFFKVIRSKLRIANESILSVYPDFEEYLEQDIISESYLASLFDDYFDAQALPVFDLISAIDDDALNDSVEGKGD